MEQHDPHAVARRGDPSTSWEAADSVTGIRESQRIVLATLRRTGPLTDEQLLDKVTDALRNGYLEAYRISPSGCRTRRAELVALGLVRDTGRRDLTASGRHTIVWEAVPTIDTRDAPVATPQPVPPANHAGLSATPAPSPSPAWVCPKPSRYSAGKCGQVLYGVTPSISEFVTSKCTIHGVVTSRDQRTAEGITRTVR